MYARCAAHSRESLMMIPWAERSPEVCLMAKTLYPDCLLGISGVSSDKRDVEEAAAAGNKRAQLASDMLNYQIKKTVGAYIAAMGGVDAIVFTGGIGEHDAIARAKVCHHMDWLGIRIDTEKNKHPVGDVCEITAWGAKVRTLVIATDGN